MFSDRSAGLAKGSETLATDETFIAIRCLPCETTPYEASFGNGTPSAMQDIALSKPSVL